MEPHEIEAALAAAQQPLSGLVAVQRAYDAVGWRVSEPAAAKFRHICLHLAKNTAKFAAIAETNDHDEDDGKPVDDATLAGQLREHDVVIAELLSYALQLAELGNVDLSDAMRKMLHRNATRFAQDSAFARLQVPEAG